MQSPLLEAVGPVREEGTTGSPRCTRRLIAAIVCNAKARRRIGDALGRDYELALCDSCEELEARLEGTKPHVLIIHLGDGSKSTAADVIRGVRERYPGVPVACMLWLTPPACSEAARVAHIGGAHLVLAEFENVASIFQRAIKEADRSSAREKILIGVRDHFPRSYEPIVQYVIDRCDARLTVDDVARVFGTSHASLYRWFAASDLPPLGQIIDWIRLCHAAHFLASGWNVEAVAAELSYGSSSVFRLALKRYTDLRPSSLRGEGGFDKVLARFTIALQMARSAHPNRDRQTSREQAACYYCGEPYAASALD